MLVTRYVVYHVNNGQDWSMNPIWNLLTPLYTTLSHSNTVYWLIDWLVFNTNFSSISSILWHEHFLYYTTINIGSRPQQPLLYNNTILRFKCCCCWCRYIFFFTSDTPQIFVKDDNKYLWCYWSPFYIPVWGDCGAIDHHFIYLFEVIVVLLITILYTCLRWLWCCWSNIWFWSWGWLTTARYQTTRIGRINNKSTIHRNI